MCGHQRPSYSYHNNNGDGNDDTNNNNINIISVIYLFEIRSYCLQSVLDV